MEKTYDVKIEKLYNENGLDIDETYKKSVLILENYRVACLEASHRSEEMKEEFAISFGSSGISEKIVAWEAFSSPNEVTELESQLVELSRTAKLTTAVDNAVAEVREFSEFGELYFKILEIAYLNEETYKTEDICRKLEISRSYYFKCKKKAILVFGYVLFSRVIKK